MATAHPDRRCLARTAVLLAAAACGPSEPTLADRMPTPAPTELDVSASLDFGRVPAGDRVFGKLSFFNPTDVVWTIEPQPVDSTALALTSSAAFTLFRHGESKQHVTFLPERLAAYTALANFSAKNEEGRETILSIELAGKGIAADSCGPCDVLLDPICTGDWTALFSARVGECGRDMCAYKHYAYPCTESCTPELRALNPPGQQNARASLRLSVSVVSCDEMPVAGALVATEYVGGDGSVTPPIARANAEGVIEAEAVMRSSRGEDVFRFHLVGWPSDVAVEVKIDAL